MSEDNCGAQRRRAKHITLDERMLIQSNKEQGLSIRQIGKILGISKSAIGAELKRGECDSEPCGYSALLGQQNYELKKKNSHRPTLVDVASDFLSEVKWLVEHEGLSINDSVKFINSNPDHIGKAINKSYKDMKKVSTQSIYHYINSGFITIDK